MNPKKPRNVKKRIATGMVAAAALVSAVGSFALFSDHATSHAEMTAGTLDLTLTQSWVSDNAAVADEYAPGDILKLDYTLENTGSLSTDIRETFVITGDKAIDGIFDIYAAEDVEQNAQTHLWAPKDGKSPIAVRSVNTYSADKDNNGVQETYYTISYAIPELTVDGSEETGDATAVTTLLTSMLLSTGCLRLHRLTVMVLSATTALRRSTALLSRRSMSRLTSLKSLLSF